MTNSFSEPNQPDPNDQNFAETCVGGGDKLEDLVSSFGDFDTASRTGNTRTIGPYKILQPLGQGGMGAVFLAEQESLFGGESHSS